MSGTVSEQACPRCSRVMKGDAFACTECANTARTDLHTIAEFLPWCDDKRARRRSRLFIGSHIANAEQGLPFDPRVTRTLDPIRNNLTTWARLVLDESEGPTEPGDDLTGITLWLAGNCDWIATKRPWAHEAFTSFEANALALTRLFDRPPDKIYVGSCRADSGEYECREALYADSGASYVACPRCGTQHDVYERRQQLAGAVDSYLGTAREISRLLRLTLGEYVNERMIRAYARHGLIQPRGTRREYDKHGRPHDATLWRIGAVREAAAVMERDPEVARDVRRLARGNTKTG